MQVILLEKIRNLGNLGDKIDVAAGFGRNYLIPQRKAVFATEKNIAIFEQRRAELEQKAQQNKSIAEQRAARLNDVTAVITAMASDEGKLYGSVGIYEIIAALQAKNIEINKKEISLPNGPFHYIGDYSVEINLHSDVIANLRIEIKTEQKKSS